MNQPDNYTLRRAGFDPMVVLVGELIEEGVSDVRTARTDEQRTEAWRWVNCGAFALLCECFGINVTAVRETLRAEVA